jgi:hypothetical protein
VDHPAPAESEAASQLASLTQTSPKKLERPARATSSIPPARHADWKLLGDGKRVLGKFVAEPAVPPPKKKASVQVPVEVVDDDTDEMPGNSAICG